MKTYREYEATSFIENIDEANAKLNRLEAKRGLTRSEFESNIDRANQRIFELEYGASTPAPVVSQPSQSSQSQDLQSLAKRRRELLNCLGLEERYFGQCKTADEYRADISKLEARIRNEAQARASAAAPKTEAPKHTPQSDAVAYFTTGKASGLARAIGAASHRAQAQK